MDYTLTCPYCFQPNALVLDVAEDGPQAYAVECAHCDRPIVVAYEVEDGEAYDVMVDTSDDG